MDKVTEIEIDAVHAFIRENVPYRGGRVVRILRTITEAIQFGTFVGSTRAKYINPTMSRKAADLMAVSTRDQFAKGTILEHTKPLQMLYCELQKRKLTRERLEAFLIYQMAVFPLVTITRKEDEDLDNYLQPHERYRMAGIEVGRVAQMTWGRRPEWEVMPHALQIIVQNDNLAPSSSGLE